MLAIISLALALVAVTINLGWLELSIGHWPGISLGLAATLAGVLELRSRPRRPGIRVLAWTGAGAGVVSALLGIAVYLGWIVAAARVG